MKYKMGKKKNLCREKLLTSFEIIRSVSIFYVVVFYFEEIEEQRKKEREKRFDNC